MADLGAGTALPGSASNGDTFFKEDEQQEYIWVNGAWAKQGGGGAIPNQMLGSVVVVATRPTTGSYAGHAVLALDTTILSVWTGSAWKGVALT